MKEDKLGHKPVLFSLKGAKFDFTQRRKVSAKAKFSFKQAR